MSQTTSQSEPAGAAVESSSLLDAILKETKIKPSDEGYEFARDGISAFITELLKPTAAGEKINSGAVDQMVAEIDRKLSAQVNEILHHQEFQKLESPGVA